MDTTKDLVPDAPSPAAGSPVGLPGRWLGYTAVLAAAVMDLLDSTIANVAAPSIRTSLGGSYADLQWIAASYTLAMAVALLVGGRLGDMFGRKRVLLTGMAGFVAGSMVCAAAQNPSMLITARLVQGAFGAVMIPQCFGIPREIFSPQEAKKAWGIFGPLMGLAAVLGPVVAGVLIHADVFGSGWRMIFGINLPIGLAALVVGAKFLPDVTPAARGVRFDAAGVLLAGAGAFLLIFPLVQGRELGWPGWTFAMMAAAVPVLGVFAWHQVRRARAGRSPLVEPALFASRAFSGGMLVGLVFFGGMAGLFLVLGLHLQLGLGFSPLRAGLTLAPWALGVAVGATLSGAWLGRRYGRPVLQAGAVVMALGIAGIVLTSHVAPRTAGWELAPALLVSGVGMGLFIAPFFDIVLAGVTLPMVGSASGVLNADQQLGSAIGVAVLGTVFFSGTGAQGMATAFDVVLWVTAGMVLAGAALAALLPRRAREEQPA
jgi:EmrB/QacA subfamily drug resistance transporter